MDARTRGSSSSFIVRVTDLKGGRVIRVQNLSTGEVAQFRTWREFLVYADEQRKQRGIH